MAAKTGGIFSTAEQAALHDPSELTGVRHLLCFHRRSWKSSNQPSKEGSLLIALPFYNVLIPSLGALMFYFFLVANTQANKET